MLVAPSSKSLELEACSLRLISVTVGQGPLLVDLQEQVGQLLILLHATFGSRCQNFFSLVITALRTTSPSSASAKVLLPAASSRI
jgi:hypothetical protein